MLLLRNLGLTTRIQKPYGFALCMYPFYGHVKYHNTVLKILHCFYMLTCSKPRTPFSTLVRNLGKEHVYEWPQSCTTQTLMDANIKNRGAGFCFRSKHGLNLGWCKISSIHRHNSRYQNSSSGEQGSKSEGSPGLTCWLVQRYTKIHADPCPNGKAARQVRNPNQRN